MENCCFVTRSRDLHYCTLYHYTNFISKGVISGSLSAPGSRATSHRGKQSALPSASNTHNTHATAPCYCLGSHNTYPPTCPTNPLGTVTSIDCFNTASHTVFGKDLYEWQSFVGYEIISDYRLFIVRPTGGGKSLVRDVRSVIFGGVSLTVLPLLSLGTTDQTQKFHSWPHCDGMRPVFAFHLDKMDEEELQRLLARIMELKCFV